MELTNEQWSDVEHLIKAQLKRKFYSIQGYSFLDLVQECLMEVNDKLDTYDITKSTLSTFVWWKSRSKLGTLLRKEQAKKREVNTNSVSLIFNDEEGNENRMCALIDMNQTVENDYILRDTLDHIIHTERDADVYRCLIKELSYTDFGKKWGYSHERGRQLAKEMRKDILALWS